MQFRVNEEVKAMSQELTNLSSDYRILVCTHNRPFAIALATVFALDPAQSPEHLLGICTKGSEALALLSGICDPVLAFVSEQLDDGPGIRLVAQLKQLEDRKHLPATVLTVGTLERHILKEAIDSPADVVLTQRGLDPKVLVTALLAIRAGGSFIDPVVRYVLREQDPQDHPDLTKRECDVLQLVCEGMTNRQIGGELHIAETTARGHVQSIIQKLHVRDRTSAAVEGLRRHWVL